MFVRQDLSGFDCDFRDLDRCTQDSCRRHEVHFRLRSDLGSSGRYTADENEIPRMDRDDGPHVTPLAHALKSECRKPTAAM